MTDMRPRAQLTVLVEEGARPSQVAEALTAAAATAAAAIAENMPDYPLTDSGQSTGHGDGSASWTLVVPTGHEPHWP